MRPLQVGFEGLVLSIVVFAIAISMSVSFRDFMMVLVR